MAKKTRKPARKETKKAPLAMRQMMGMSR